MAAQQQEKGAKGPLVWQQAKLDHRRHFIQRLISTPIPLVILCLRARYPMKEDKAKKEWARSEVLVPMQSEDILFEMFVHGWIDKEHNFHGTKYTLDELRSVIEDGKPISIESGRRLAAWARGGATSGPASLSSASSVHAPASPGPTTGKPAVLAEIKKELAGLKHPEQRQKVCKDVFGVASWADVEALPLDTLKAAITPADGADIARLEAAVITAKEGAA
jgi:hypothetical protein